MTKLILNNLAFKVIFNQITQRNELSYYIITLSSYRTLEDDVILLYHLWQDIHELVQNTNFVHYEFRRAVMTLILKYS